MTEQKAQYKTKRDVEKAIIAFMVRRKLAILAVIDAEKAKAGKKK